MTRVVYVVVGYDCLSQFYLSASTLRRTNDVKITILTDRIIEHPLNPYSLADEVKVYKKVYDDMKMSRYLKTNIRNLIDGEYLYVDTDTFFCGDISPISDFEGDILAVADVNDELKLPKTRRNLSAVTFEASRYGFDPLGKEYFNSGVMYVRDNEITRNFYKRWNHYRSVGFRIGCYHDQQPLCMTNEEFHIIKEMDGIYNCQCSRLGRNFADRGVILHTFNIVFKYGLMKDLLDEIKKGKLEIFSKFIKDTRKFILNNTHI